MTPAIFIVIATIIQVETRDAASKKDIPRIPHREVFRNEIREQKCKCDNTNSPSGPRLRQGLVYLTQNIQIAFKYANRSATFGRNLSSHDGILYHSQGVGSSENKVLVSELGRNEVSSNFKSLDHIANTAPRSGVPLCPMLFRSASTRQSRRT